MQGTSKPLPFNARNEIVNLFNAGLGLSDIPRNTRVLKELFIKKWLCLGVSTSFALKESNAHVKNAIFIPRLFMREAR